MTNLKALRTGLRITSLAEKYFPERLESIIVVNAHPIAIGVYNRLIKGLLHERTRDKFQFYTDDDVLREIFDESQLEDLRVGRPSQEEVALSDHIRHAK